MQPDICADACTPGFISPRGAQPARACAAGATVIKHLPHRPPPGPTQVTNGVFSGNLGFAGGGAIQLVNIAKSVSFTNSAFINNAGGGEREFEPLGSASEAIAAVCTWFSATVSTGFLRPNMLATPARR